MMDLKTSDFAMKNTLHRFAIRAVYLHMAGVILSGLVFPALAQQICPQPEWQDATTFADAFHPLQTATFFLGFLLVLGSLMVFVALHLSTAGDKKLYSLTALAINTVFTAIIFVNYIIQTTYIPYLATYRPPEMASILPMLTMSNPGSLAWAFEMYGWGGVGLSFIFAAPVFEKEGRDRWLRLLFLANGLCSIGSAFMTSIDMNWLFTSAGIAALVVWNTLVLVIDVFLLGYFRQRPEAIL